MNAAGSSVTVATLLREGEARFVEVGIPTPRLDAEVLMAAALAVSRAGLYARLRDPVDGESGCRFRAMVERRGRREPVAYVLESKEFYSLAFKVTEAVLIPRPETEQLVEAVVRRLAGHAAPLVCDVGTGSGCIAVAVAVALPRARIVATDVSVAALSVARCNARTHGVLERIRFVALHALNGIAGDLRFDVIASNPPYLRPGDAVSPEVHCEPPLAFAAGGDGLAVIRRLIQAAPSYLHDRGTLIVEIGAEQAAAVQSLALGAGFRNSSIQSDLAGRPRVLIAPWEHAAPPAGRWLG